MEVGAPVSEQDTPAGVASSEQTSAAAVVTRLPGPGRGMNLPQAANGLSEERREALLARAQTEIAEAENDGDVPGVPAPSALERLASYTVLLVCGTAFLSLLLVKLQSGSPSWLKVFVPLLLISSLDLARHLYHALKCWNGEERVSPWVVAHRLLDAACTVACEVSVMLYLRGTIPEDTSFLLVLLPAWVSAATSTVLLCCTPVPDFLTSSPQAIETYKSSLLVTGAFHFAQTGVQVLLVALKLDGTISSSWAAVFTPCWLFLSVSALFYGVTICVLFGACCIVVATGDRSGAELRAFILVWFGQVAMVVAWTVCLFLFLIFLTERLDGDDSISSAQIITPLLVLFVVLPLLVPLNHMGAQALHSARVLAAAEREASGGAGFNGTGSNEREEVVLEALAAPTALLRTGSTYFRRATSSLISRFGDDGLDGLGGGVDDEYDEECDLNDGSADIGTRVDVDVEAAEGDASGSRGSRRRGGSSGGGRAKAGAAATGRAGEVGEATAVLDRMAALEAERERETALRRQSDSLTGSRTCYICQTEAADAVLMECGHGGICYQCGLSLLKVGAQQRCPICRADVNQVLRLSAEALASGRYNRILQSAEGVALQRHQHR